jgi:hypothetical protein
MEYIEEICVDENLVRKDFVVKIPIKWTKP